MVDRHFLVARIVAESHRRESPIDHRDATPERYLTATWRMATRRPSRRSVPLGRPALERSGPLVQQDLETVDDARSGGIRRRARAPSATVVSVRQVDDDLAAPRLNDGLVPYRRGVHDDVEARRVGRPAGIASPDHRHVEAAAPRARRAQPSPNRRGRGPAPSRTTRNRLLDRDDVGARAQHAAVAKDERVHRLCMPRVVLDLVAELDHCRLVRDRHVRAGEAGRRDPFHCLRQLARGVGSGT